MRRSNSGGRGDSRLAKTYRHHLLGSMMGAAIGIGMIGSQAAAHGPDAFAQLHGTHDEPVASAILYETAGGVQVSSSFDWLSPGEYQLSIHPGRRCDQLGGPPAEDQPLSLLDVMPLPDVAVVPGQSRPYLAVASGVTLTPGPRSLLGPAGSLLVVTPRQADETPSTVAENGRWLACGMIVPPEDLWLLEAGLAVAMPASEVDQRNGVATLPAAGEMPPTWPAGLTLSLLTLGMGLRHLARKD